MQAGSGLRRALTVAGSDCSGGAGIQADLKTFHAFGVYGSSAVTAVVAENTLGVQGMEAVRPDLVALQVESCLSDIGADAVKTGMLASAAVVAAVAGKLRDHGVAPLVVDPVMRAKDGRALIDPDALAVMVGDLLPLAAVVTPNVAEAEALAGGPIRTEADLLAAAKAIRAMGPRLVVMKGGHFEGGPEGLATDFVWDGEDWRPLAGARVAGRGAHGTGCTFSAAITALLALGEPPGPAIARAKRFITEAIRTAPDLGRGHPPVNHWART